jgi:copper chaperone CopZ
MTAVKYLHHTPGRLRIKGQHFNCHGERARKAVATLQAMPGVETVKLNPRAGSLTVHYDPDIQTQAELLAALETAGCLHLAAGAQTRAPARPGAPREGVTDLFGKALVGALAQRTATKLIGALL